MGAYGDRAGHARLVLGSSGDRRILVGMRLRLPGNSVSERVLSSGDYIVTRPTTLEITPLPPWIRTKIAQQVVSYI